MSSQTADLAPLGIKRIEALNYYVHDLERTRHLLVDQLDFAEIGESSTEMNERGRQRAVVFQAGDCTYTLIQPIGEGGRAWRFLRKHPEGVGTVIFEVEDAEVAYKLLDERGGTFITEIERFEDAGGTLATFSITTPFGDTTFRFVERKGYTAQFPGFVAHETPKGGQNRFGFTHIDHVTSNFPTMKPALLWMQHVLGFKQYWDVEFHTVDVTEKQDHGSGLKSVVMFDPHSGVKFANNEPASPFFKDSQINLFAEDHRGAGVQHTALVVGDIITAVRQMRERGVQFMPTPGTYYDMLPERLKTIGVEEIEEDHAILRELQILVDGDANRQYMLQIFLKDAAGMHNDPEAGPFFFEIIQRKGDNGFGAGNFRALFESIERQQRSEGRL
ncbi:MAG: 4-hydroxyphenylpyruvate dioxygenase [Bradymonadia bacterium]